MIEGTGSAQRIAQELLNSAYRTDFGLSTQGTRVTR